MITLKNGVVVSEPVNAGDVIMVSVPNLTDARRVTFGPMSFRPQITGSGTIRIPQRGDAAVIAVDDQGPEWLVEWHRGDDISEPSDLDARIDALELPGLILDSLPADPFDGQEIYYQTATMGLLGILWNFRYNDSEERWDGIGGQRPITAYTVNNLAFSSGVYIAAPDGLGPSVTVPLAGSYDVRLEGEAQNAAGIRGYMSFAVGATNPPNDDEAMWSLAVEAACAFTIHGKVVPAASTVLAARYRNNASTANWAHRQITAAPVYVTE